MAGVLWAVTRWLCSIVALSSLSITALYLLDRALYAFTGFTVPYGALGWILAYIVAALWIAARRTRRFAAERRAGFPHGFALDADLVGNLSVVLLIVSFLGSLTM
jgi:hypothetical protein